MKSYIKPSPLFREEELNQHKELRMPMPEKPSEDFIKPAYYKLPGGGDLLDAYGKIFGIEAEKNAAKFNVFKYLERYQKKNGVEDLKKAQTYLSRLIEMEEGENK